MTYFWDRKVRRILSKMGHPIVYAAGIQYKHGNAARYSDTKSKNFKMQIFHILKYLQIIYMFDKYLCVNNTTYSCYTPPLLAKFYKIGFSMLFRNIIM